MATLKLRKQTEILMSFVRAAVLSFAMSAPMAANAQAPDSRRANGSYFQFEGDPAFAALRQDVGYRLNPADLSAPFVVLPIAIKIFAEMAPLRNRLAYHLPFNFKPVVVDVSNYMKRMRGPAGATSEKLNGLTDWQLAIKITRLAFCFKTDPMGIAAQIYRESTFDRRRVSPTGAVGFTQMTGIAIDEVNDQLGNRGVLGANLQNIPFLRQAVGCYMGGRPFQSMFAAGIIQRGQTVANHTRARERAKAWLRADVDRDLIYGQITLKVMLATVRADGATGVNAYKQAFKKYNGEPRGRDAKYSREIVRSMISARST